jgi:hypothetical protein
MKKFLAACLAPLLAHCATAPAPCGEISTAAYDKASLSRNLAGVKIPVLQSFHLEKKWASRFVVLKNGGYSITYTKPGEQNESLAIYGAPGRISSESAPQPPTFQGAPQIWKTAKILGKPIRYYQMDTDPSGAMIPTLSTVTFTIETPEQPVASYRIVATSFHQDLAKYAEAYLKAVDGF